MIEVFRLVSSSYDARSRQELNKNENNQILQFPNNNLQSNRSKGQGISTQPSRMLSKYLLTCCRLQTRVVMWRSINLAKLKCMYYAAKI